jgi:hypothetical protein
MNLIELGSVLGDFFEGGAGPSHDELDRAIARAGLQAGDPAPAGRSSHGPVGKTKRIRQVLVYATDHDRRAGFECARQVVDLLRAAGVFEPSLATYAGQDKCARLRDAFSRLGYDLDPNGCLRARVVDNLEGTSLTDALRAYVDRINLNPDDAPLQVGTGKELDEAVARHVLLERVGQYPTGGPAGSFPVTLAQAFTVLGLEVPPDLHGALHSDPGRQVQQCLFLLGVAVNRLRNDAGSGHGRPDPPRKTGELTQEQARVVARATALIAGMLLDEL